MSAPAIVAMTVAVASPGALPAFAPSVTDLAALLGWAVVVAAAVATLAAGAGARRGRRLTVAGVGLLLVVTAVLPAAARLGDGLTWAAVLRGHAADPSVVLVVAALWRWSARVAGRPVEPGSEAARAADRDRCGLLGLVVVAGWTLILTQLATDRIDPYRWGYLADGLVAVTAGVALVAALRGRVRTATALAAALAAWGLGLVESTNLWDALVDPWLTLAATGWWLRRGVRRLAGAGRARTA